MQPAEKKRLASLPVKCLVDVIPAGPLSVVYQFADLRSHARMRGVCKLLSTTGTQDNSWCMRLRVLGGLGYFPRSFVPDCNNSATFATFVAASEDQLHQGLVSDMSAEVLYLTAECSRVLAGAPRRADNPAIWDKIMALLQAALARDASHFWARVLHAFGLCTYGCLDAPGREKLKQGLDEFKKLAPELTMRAREGDIAAHWWIKMMDSIFESVYEAYLFSVDLPKFELVAHFDPQPTAGAPDVKALGIDEVLALARSGCFPAGFLRARQMLAPFCAQAVRILEEGAARHNADCMAELAKGVLNGRGELPRDADRAYTMLHCAAALGSEDACWHMFSLAGAGRFDPQRFGVIRSDYSRGLDLFRCINEAMKRVQL